MWWRQGLLPHCLCTCEVFQACSWDGHDRRHELLKQIVTCYFHLLDVEEAFVERNLLGFGDVRIKHEGPHHDRHVDTGQYISCWPQSHEIEVRHNACPMYA